MKSKLFIGVPIYGGVDIRFFDAFVKFIEAKNKSGLDCVFCPMYGDSLVSRARNSITMEFLKSDCTHLLMIDSDLVFSLDQITRLLSHDVDIVGGFYPKKKEGDIEFVFNCLDDQQPPDERGLSEVKYIGTGFMCIAKGVFEKMISELGDELIFKVDEQHKVGFDFWSVGIYKFANGDRRYLSEDWYFCQRARDLGYSIYGDNRVFLKHSGAALYPLKTQEDKFFGEAIKTASSVVSAVEAPPLVPSK